MDRNVETIDKMQEKMKKKITVKNSKSQQEMLVRNNHCDSECHRWPQRRLDVGEETIIEFENDCIESSQTETHGQGIVNIHLEKI